MAHRNNKLIAALSFASILGIASLGQIHAGSYSDYLDNGIFWSSVGAAGQVDSTSASIAKTSKASITMAAPGTLVVRYSVPPSAELASAKGGFHIMANLFDPGAGASVTVSLLEVQVDKPGESITASPIARTVLRLSSSDIEGLAGFATRCVAEPLNQNFEFAFDQNVYYIQAVLTWDSKIQPLAPALRALDLGFHAGAACPVAQ